LILLFFLVFHQKIRQRYKFSIISSFSSATTKIYYTISLKSQNNSLFCYSNTNNHTQKNNQIKQSKSQQWKVLEKLRECVYIFLSQKNLQACSFQDFLSSSDCKALKQLNIESLVDWLERRLSFFILLLVFLHLSFDFFCRAAVKLLIMLYIGTCHCFPVWPLFPLQIFPLFLVYDTVGCSLMHTRWISTTNFLSNCKFLAWIFQWLQPRIYFLLVHFFRNIEFLYRLSEYYASCYRGDLSNTKEISTQYLPWFNFSLESMLLYDKLCNMTYVLQTSIIWKP